MMGLLRRIFGKKYIPSEDSDSDGESIEPIEVTLPFSGDFATDTASLVAYDLGALRHRFDDECDWWADPREELAELRARNLLIVGLGSDGFYDLTVTKSLAADVTRYSLQVPSGRFFIGPGEEVTGGGFEPDGKMGGIFVPLKVGDYAITVTRKGEGVCLGLAPSEPFENTTAEPVQV